MKTTGRNDADSGCTLKEFQTLDFDCTKDEKMSAMNVANAFPTLPTRIAGAINSSNALLFANAAAEMGHLFALRQIKIFRGNGESIANKWITYRTRKKQQLEIIRKRVTQRRR